ncbi:MAG: DUF2142 domain-containing protein [Caldilineales bacterium]|nr:DUF2142 domain-containing protein [Caldilineales bacterium]
MPRPSPPPGRTWRPTWPWVWGIALALAAGTGWVWAWATPPWDAPDEPGHVLYAAWLSTRPWPEWLRQPTDFSVAPNLEEPILASLAAHDWWERQGRVRPEPLPTRFAEDPLLAAGGIQAADEPPLFYLVPALFLRGHGLRADPAMVLPWLRLWSLALRLAAVATALVLARRLWPRWPERGLGLSLGPGLLPMAGFIGSSFNNDSLAMAWGALGFALLVANPPARTRRFALVAGWILAGPLVADVGLLYLVGLLVLVGVWRWRYRRAAALGLVLLTVLGLLPVSSWAAGWRREPWSARTRWGSALAPTAPMWQYVDPKTVLALRGQTLTLVATAAEPTLPTRLRLRLADDAHENTAVCDLGHGVVCRLGLKLSPAATSLRVAVEPFPSNPDGASLPPPLTSHQSPVTGPQLSPTTHHSPTHARFPVPRLQLRLLDEAGHDRLFNGSGLLPDRLGSPVWTWLERRLPLPAGFFARALAPSTWDAPSLFRYLLFAVFTWASFWGYFGWLSRPLPWPGYGLAGAITLAAAWGLARWGLAALRRYRRRVTTRTDTLLGMALAAVVLLLMQVWLPMLGQSWQPQGRYLFPGLLPVACLLWLGCETALPHAWRPRLPWLLLAALLALQAMAWR